MALTRPPVSIPEFNRPSRYRTPRSLVQKSVDCPLPLPSAGAKYPPSGSAGGHGRPRSASKATLNTPSLNAFRFLPFLQEAFPDLLQCGSKQFVGGCTVFRAIFADVLVLCRSNWCRTQVMPFARVP